MNKKIILIISLVAIIALIGVSYVMNLNGEPTFIEYFPMLTIEETIQGIDLPENYYAMTDKERRDYVHEILRGIMLNGINIDELEFTYVISDGTDNTLSIGLFGNMTEHPSQQIQSMLEEKFPNVKFEVKHHIATLAAEKVEYVTLDSDKEEAPSNVWDYITSDGYQKDVKIMNDYTQIAIDEPEFKKVVEYCIEHFEDKKSKGMPPYIELGYNGTHFMSSQKCEIIFNQYTEPPMVTCFVSNPPQCALSFTGEKKPECYLPEIIVPDNYDEMEYGERNQFVFNSFPMTVTNTTSGDIGEMSISRSGNVGNDTHPLMHHEFGYYIYDKNLRDCSDVVSKTLKDAFPENEFRFGAVIPVN